MTLRPWRGDEDGYQGAPLWTGYRKAVVGCHDCDVTLIPLRCWIDPEDRSTSTVYLCKQCERIRYLMARDSGRDTWCEDAEEK